MATSEPAVPRRGITLTQQIFIGLAIGILAGWIVSTTHPEWAPYFRPFSQLFLRMMWDPLESTCRHASLSIL